MLRADPGRRTVRAAKHNRAAHLTAGHIQRLGGRVDNMVDGLHGEVKRHKFDDRLEPAHCRAHTDPGKAVLCDRCIDNAFAAKFLE